MGTQRSGTRGATAQPCRELVLRRGGCRGRRASPGSSDRAGVVRVRRRGDHRARCRGRLRHPPQPARRQRRVAAPRHRARALRGRRRRLRRRDRGFGAPAAIRGPTSCTWPRTRCSPSRSSAPRPVTVPTARPRSTAPSSPLAASAVIWQWVVTPVVDSTAGGATLERMVTVAYPIMDVAAGGGDRARGVHAAAMGQRRPGSCSAGLAVMLVADAVYARLVADGNYVRRRPARRALAHRLRPVRGRGAAPVDAHALGSAPTRGSSGTGVPGWSCSARRCSRRRRWCSSTTPGASERGRARPRSSASPRSSWPGASPSSWPRPNQARDVLGESEARFRALVQHSTDVIAVIDPVGP